MRLLAYAGEEADHRPIEGRDVVWLAAGDQASIDDNLLIHPIGTRVLKVGLERRPGC